jgi:hypothetical protein
MQKLKYSTKINKMEKVILYVDFQHQGPFGKEMAENLQTLAESINEEPGFIWKMWTENEKNKEVGGVYLFDNRKSAEIYLEKHMVRLSQWGYEDVTYKIFEINVQLTKINHSPILY